MDPDTSKKVDDLLGLVQGISSEIDVAAELARIEARIEDLEGLIEDVRRRLDALEKAQKERQKIVDRLRRELKGLFP
ncbi:MAG TPA: hypothetical protein PLW83_01645 [Deltaproteobacteria bacterium]|nr:hypothetical protein [Deltaproteobacteria bacterium]